MPRPGGRRRQARRGASCVRCHGVDGISNTKAVPHLAGQRAAYLHLELKAYQSGAPTKKPWRALSSS